MPDVKVGSPAGSYLAKPMSKLAPLCSDVLKASVHAVTTIIVDMDSLALGRAL